MRILVTRPLEDGAEIARLLAARGHHALLAPLLEPRFQEGPLLEEEGTLEDVAAILASSANGIRALRRRTARRDLPIFAVGPQTAGEARRAGFSNVRSADGDAKALAEATRNWGPPGATLLHVCAEDAPGTLSDLLSANGFTVRRGALYRIEPATQLPPEAKAALQSRALDAAMFFSPRTARIFTTLVETLPTDSLIALCISPATAGALTPRSFAEIRVAARPNQDAMLAITE
ncbi:MAG TPA: uroporphyrinogen-III synthase [Rhizomicrobium sp.]|nr:uroporphyrinogen-III synthase [Rhizomicrobium sp.]